MTGSTPCTYGWSAFCCGSPTSTSDRTSSIASPTRCAKIYGRYLSRQENPHGKRRTPDPAAARQDRRSHLESAGVTVTTAVFYDHNFDLAHTVEPEDVIDANALAGTLTIPLDHPAARWLYASTEDESRRTAFAAVRDSASQWRGRLMSWEIHHRGTCPECDHCQQKVMTTKWTIPPR